MSDIYKLHESAFANVSAFVIAKDGERVGTIAFKFPRDGAGRLYAYVHFLGMEMTRGFANGYGYDKRSAACSAATKRMVDKPGTLKDWSEAQVSTYDAFRAALTPDDGYEWHSRLRTAGFEVWQAV